LHWLKKSDLGDLIFESILKVEKLLDVSSVIESPVFQIPVEPLEK
jgi:hypothetical protein